MEETKITEELYPYFEKVSEIKHYQPGQYIYFEGDLSNQFYAIKKGRVRVYFMSLDGEEMTMDIIEKRAYFGRIFFF